MWSPARQCDVFPHALHGADESLATLIVVADGWGEDLHRHVSISFDVPVQKDGAVFALSQHSFKAVVVNSLTEEVFQTMIVRCGSPRKH